MPVAVAVALRYLIMAAAQLAIWTLLEKYGIPLLNYGIQSIIEKFGVDEETAKDIMANKVLVAFEEVGIFAITLKTKMPIKVAEYLGFTSKGWSKRKLSQAVEAKLVGTEISATAKAVATQAEIESVIKVAAKSGRVNASVASSLFKQITGSGATIALWYLALINTIDFANWQGAYQKTFQKIFTVLGFPPDTPMPKANTLSADTWKRIYATIETLDPIGINDPFSNADKPYSRANLAEMIDKIAANIVKNGGQATYKNVIGLTLPLIQLKGQPDITKMDNMSYGSTSTTGTGSTTGATTNAVAKVFTGIVSQGVVQSGLSFTARQDDLIENVDELKTAASNNLAPFLQALPGKVIYEVKIVSSITTKDGFVQRGTTQKIQTGTTKAGVPTYKTVTNKFATLLLYILNDKGSRTKISTIVLGPVDSARFQVQQNDLTTLQSELPKLVTTSDISEVTSIVSNTPVATVTPQGATITATPKIKLGSTQYYSFITNGQKYLQTLPYAGNVPYEYTQLTKEQYISELQAQMQTAQDFVNKWDTSVAWNIVPKDKTNWDGSHYSGRVWTQSEVDGLKNQIKEIQDGKGIYAPDWRDPSFTNFQAYAPTPSAQYFTEFYFNTLPVSEQNRLKALYPGYSFGLDTAPVVSANAAQSSQTTAGQKPGANATTLFEWYQAQGQNLPNIQTRASTYEQLGLGQAAYYTGTAEQNTKLLNALKQK